MEPPLPQFGEGKLPPPDRGRVGEGGGQQMMNLMLTTLPPGLSHGRLRPVDLPLEGGGEETSRERK